MYRLCAAIAVAFAVALAPAVSEGAQRKQKTSQTKSQSHSRPPVIIRDPSLFRPPPPPQPRNYYGPAPSIQGPMERIPLPAPLSQPPIR